MTVKISENLQEFKYIVHVLFDRGERVNDTCIENWYWKFVISSKFTHIYATSKLVTFTQLRGSV